MNEPTSADPVDGHAAKLAAMTQPESLRSEEYQVWSRGRGVDVWAMLCASITGDLETIRSLMARDPNLVECEYEYFKPIQFAVRENQRAVVDFLLDNGADSAYEAGDSLVGMARERGYTELTALFESKLKERYNVVPEGAAVAAAIRDRDEAQVRALIDLNPELAHAADERASRPIHWAAMTRQRWLIDYLLDRGADVNAVRPDGLRPIHLTNGDYHYRGWRDLPSVALQRHEVLIGYLIARGADYDLATAAKLGDLDRVRELLDQDPSLVNHVPTYSYYTGVPLRNAAGAGHLEVVNLLLERGADPNQPEPGIAPHGGALHSAIGGRHMAVVKVLLEHGANPNAEVESSGNCLSMAKFAGAPKEMIELIASYGGVMGADMADLETLAAMLHANPKLRVGERLGDPAVMELILRYQPDILQRTPDPTAWWSHGTPKDAEFARRLMRRGLDPNRRNWLGITLLHRCAAKGDVAIAEVCLEFGGDINAVETQWSSTPLAWAAREGRQEMVAWLLSKGANPKLPEVEPWAHPVEWARRRRHDSIVELLRQHLRR
ncbi:MAG: ankyrin repeat domain-containing protein [Bryobacteraceae bacterium]